MNHWKRCHIAGGRAPKPRLDHLRLRRFDDRFMGVCGFMMWLWRCLCLLGLLCLLCLLLLCLLGLLLALLSCSRSFFSSKIILCESLLLSFRFPVIISHSPATDNDSATKLPKHAPGCDNCDLPGTVRIGQQFLSNEVIFFSLRGNDLIQTAILVEKKVRVTIS